MPRRVCVIPARDILKIREDGVKLFSERPPNSEAAEIVWDKATGKLQVIYKEIASEEATSGRT